ncbi:MAG: helix-hairpin-helix domain-containing protein [Phycisphaerae bacterium]|nr:helix-hairpin-helix domain-containing protein [Phycisphaerae bacterium]
MFTETRDSLRNYINRAADSRSIAGEQRRRIERVRLVDVTYVAVALCLAAIGGIRGTPIGDRSDSSVEPRLADGVRRGINPNTASWSEIALLPGLGASVGKRVVEYRELRCSEAGGGTRAGHIFNGPVDLLAIRGIGSQTLARIGPFLTFE